MSAFWFFARKMLRRRAAVGWAMFFAFATAGGLGVGLVSLLPVLRLILGTGTSLVELANRYNAEGHAIAVPQWVVARLPEGRLAGVIVVVAGILVLTVVGGAAGFMHQYLSQAVAAKTVGRIRQDLFRHVVNLPLVTVIKRGPTDFAARIVRDTAELQRGFVSLLSKAVTNVLKGSAAFLAAIFFHWQLTLTAVVVAPLLAIVLRKLGKRIRRGTSGSLQGQQGLLRVATETLHGLRAVKANTGERRASQWFARINKVVVQQELRVLTARALSSPLVEVIAITIVGALAVLAARQIIANPMAFERFALALGSLGIAGAALKPMAGLVTEVQAAAAAADRLAEILGEQREAATGIRLRNLPRHCVSITFDDVTYTYPGAHHPAVASISLDLAAGSRLAIVGPNGSGKTTLVALLPRLLEPQSGRVLIDSIDLATVSLRSLRRQVGVVTQETVLFRGTIAENITFGASPEDSADRSKLVEAARRAHADEFIRELPDGYDTVLSERGASLSGGQRQRLAIARAVLRDPAILILDEATSQIDAESEGHINAAIAEFCRGRTAVLIAHRLSTVLNADEIVVIDGGRLLARGTHANLLATCDVYRRLTQTQLVGAV